MTSTDRTWRPPVARRRLIPRRRLVDRLPLGADPLPRLVVVCAPAGFGKTTLLTQWLDAWRDRNDDRHVAWVSLQTADDDPRRLLADLVAAVTGAVPGVGRQASRLLAEQGRATPELVVSRLLADLDDLQGSLVIALDDYHLVHSDEAHAVIAALLDRLPPTTALALTARADPPLPLARLRARGELAEIRAAELRFDATEAVTFLNDAMGLSLEERQVAALQGRTEGWAVGLQLAALSLRDHDDPGAFIDRFTGSHRFVLDYLVEEVLAGIGDDERAFLLDTCLLDALTGPLCDALTGGDDGQERLAALERANLFVVPLDENRTWYRYHHLFAEALRARTSAADPDRMRALHRAAADWFAAHDRSETAIEHAVRALDHDLAAHLIEVSLPAASRRRQDRTMHRWLGLLPPAQLETRPVLQVAAAWARLGAGDIDDAERRLLLAEQNLDAPPATTPDAVTDLDGQLRQLPTTIAMYRAAIAQARGDVPGTTVQARRVLALAGPTDHLRRGAGYGFLGMSLWADGDLPAAIDTFTQCARSMHLAGNLTDELGCTVPLAQMWWARGRPDEAARLHRQALDGARDHPDVALPVLGDLHVGLAACLVERGDLAGAAEHLASARDLGDAASLPENRHRWYLTAARLRQAHGDPDGAAALLDRAQASYLPGFFPDLQPIPAVRARIDLARGRVEHAQEWAREWAREWADDWTRGPGGAQVEVTYRTEYSRLTFVRLLLAQDEPAQAGALLARLQAAAEEAGRDGSLIEILALDALARMVRGERDEAAEQLARAVELAVPAGYARIFLDEGPAMTDLLADVRRRGRALDLLQRLHRAEATLGDESRSSPTDSEPSTSDRRPDQTLSRRELEVLRLLAGELSGPEIASRLFVSVNTLRTHTRHIFDKLEVTTRTGAVLRGRERGLI